jgi:hypothetical protein
MSRASAVENVGQPIAALRTMADGLWDPRVGMSRLAAGVNPSVDLSAFDLHPVRETVLGAILDLGDGRAERGVTAIERVLAQQYELSDDPWSGTFTLTAEQPPPPPDAQEWVHYDPNWRQFIGCALAAALELHPRLLDPSLTAAMEAAIERAVRGELAGRIPVWYTNPRLMHAWLTAWVGARAGDRGQVAAGEAIGAEVVRRVEKYGDVDEYNSPTYDGIDLLALALWQRWSPSPWFAEQGERITRVLAQRMSTLFHPRLAAICGPYIRAYGISLDRYVSLAGQWLALAGADATRVLPPILDASTDHVHDLFFLPLVAELSDVVVPHLQLRDVHTERRHVQTFGRVEATSVLDATYAIGAERGRVHEFARDQYVPFTVHFDDGGVTRSLAILLPEATATADCEVTARGECRIDLVGRTDVTALRVLASEPVSGDDRALELGRVRMQLSSAPTAVAELPCATGTMLELTWAGPGVAAAVSVRR